ncbi:hypothetical protein ACVXG8_20970 [Escherichia coli]
MPSGVAAVTAARGRGKSALAGQLISVLRVVRLSLRPQKRQRMYWHNLRARSFALLRRMPC